MSGEPADGGAHTPSPILVFVRSIAFGVLAGGASGPAGFLAWMAIDTGAQGDNPLLALLLSIIPGVAVGLALGLAYGVVVAIWVWIRRPSVSAVRLVLAVLTILVDVLLVWRYRLEPVLATVALPLALPSIWIGTRLVLKPPDWVDDFAAKS